MIFPYTAWEVAANSLAKNRIVQRPMVPLTVWGNDSLITVAALLDTGADHTLLPLSVGKEANVMGSIFDETVSLKGFGGQLLTVFTGYVDLQMTDGTENYRWPASVGFVQFEDPKDEVAVLGRGEFFDYFKVVFDPVGHKAVITPTERFRGSERLRTSHNTSSTTLVVSLDHAVTFIA